jgi:Tat protein secretion system quality control protein TatD with DNase activity
MYGGRSGRAKGKAPKSKKLKCILCQAKGHDAASCPQIKDDDDHKKKEQVLKATLMQPTLGFGKTHKTSRKAGTILSSAVGSNNHNNDIDGNENNHHTENIYDMFRDSDDFAQNSHDNYEPLIILDGGCDIGATLDHIATTITNSNLKKARITYQNTIGTTVSSCTSMTSSQQMQESPSKQQYDNNFIHYGASICRFLIKPDYNGRKSLLDNPRITTILETNPNTYFVVGLGPGFFMNDSIDDNTDKEANESDDFKAAFDALLEAITENSDSAADKICENWDSNATSPTSINDRIVGLYGKLDYSPEMTNMIAYDTTTQLNKLRVTCQVAIKCQLPIQIKINPSAVPPNYMTNSLPAANQDTKKAAEEYDEVILQQAEAYKQVVKDLAKVLLEMPPTKSANNAISSNQGLLRVHLSSWSGTEMHMNHLLQAFPQNLYIGLNATIGYTKHKHLHECAFTIPIDRCILESDAPNAIPSQLHNKKKMFCHSGCILYTAVSISDHKRHSISPIDVLRTTTQNTIQLYGGCSSIDVKSSLNNPTVSKNGLALHFDDVKRQARGQRKKWCDLQQQQFQEHVADEQISSMVDTKSDAVFGTAEPPFKLHKKRNNNINLGNNADSNIAIDDDVLLAELVSEMLTDNEATKI